MIFSVNFSSLPGMSQTSAGSFLTGDTRKIFVSNIKTVDESHSARVLIGCKPIRSFPSLFLYFTYPFSLPLQFSSTVRAALHSKFTSTVHHGTLFYFKASCRATPALRHWLTYRVRLIYLFLFLLCVCCALLFSILAFALTHSSVGRGLFN